MPSSTLTPLVEASPSPYPGASTARKAHFWDRIAFNYAAVPVPYRAGHEPTPRCAQGLPSVKQDVLDIGRGSRNTALRLAVLAATFLAQSPLAQAQTVSPEPAYGLSGRIGLGVATVPTYEGSPNRRTLTGPDVTLSYRSRDWGAVELGQRGLIWNAVEAGEFRFGLVAQFDLGRKDQDTSTLNPTPGDKRLAGMGNVRASTEAGVGLGYGPVMLVARQSVGGRGHSGVQADLTAQFPWSLSERLGLHVSLGATWADRDYMQAYFGVTAAQAQATSFPVYTPKSGCRKTDLSVGAEYTIASRLKFQANVGFSRLEDDAAASPLVARRDGLSAALGFAHEF